MRLAACVPFVPQATERSRIMILAWIGIISLPRGIAEACLNTSLDIPGGVTRSRWRRLATKPCEKSGIGIIMVGRGPPETLGDRL
jgi:hypothetical protein